MSGISSEPPKRISGGCIKQKEEREKEKKEEIGKGGRGRKKDGIVR